ncbi:MAG TPA: glutamate--tRNA ligase family protein, partial [Gemmataceae bacterium]
DAASRLIFPHEGPVYPGTCAHRSAADAAVLEAAGRPFAWRFRVHDSPSFHDRFLGPVHIDLRQTGGDFVVWKSAGTPAYQLAVVIDDAAMGITEVIRGDDLIPSTPRQLLLFRALGYAPPTFAHVPLVVGQDGRRLAKRHGDTRLSSMKGKSASELIGKLALSCGWLDKPEPITAKELIGRFRLESIPKAPFVWKD